METERVGVPGRPGAGLVASLSWTVFGEALRDMPTLFVSALVVNGALLALQWALDDAVPSLMPGHQPYLRAAGWAFAAFALSAAQSLVLASVAVAIHRLILRDEKDDSAIAPFRTHTLRFAAWLIVLQLPWLLVLMAVPMRAIGGVPLMVEAAAAITIAILYPTTRLSLMFPAIAIDAPSASLGERLASSWALSRGRFWTLALSAVLVVVPVIIAVFVLGLALYAVYAFAATAAGQPIHYIGHAMNWPRLVLDDISHVLTAALGASALSWNYKIAQMERAGVDFSAAR